MMVPPFDLQGGVGLALARGLAVCGMLSVFGALAFRVLVLPRACAFASAADTATAKRQILIVSQASTACAILGIGLWLVLQSAIMADASSVRAALAAVPLVLSETVFGHVVAPQGAVLAVLAVVLGRGDREVRQRAGLALAAAALALQAGHGHAFAMVAGPSLLLGADILHLLGAGGWLGGLLPLLLFIRLAPPKEGAMAARWFSPLGKVCVGALLVSAAWQGWILVGSVPRLIGTAYGWMAIVKAVLFAVLLGFAWINRHRFAPALARQSADGARRVLIASIFLQSLAALSIVAAAIVLSGLPPAMHLQPLWPFPERFSLAAVRDDADFRREAIVAALAVLAGLVLMGVALIRRRFRMAALAAAIGSVWFAWPSADLVLAPAYPTSFYRSPTGFTPASIVAGADVYAAHCVACHGAQGHGDGALAKTLTVPPADLTAAHLWMHSDGELFWWIGHGMAAPDGSPAMPGFADVLDDEARWDVIDDIRAHNAGLTVGADGAWGRPVRAPSFSALCAGDRTRTLADYAGAPLLVAIGARPPAVGGLQKVVASDRLDPAPGLCVADASQTGRAFAIVSGQPGDAAGALFLIDPRGMLRRMWRPGHAPDAGAVAAALASITGPQSADAAQPEGGMAGMKMHGMKM